MRALPIVKFEGTKFYVDIRLQEFREMNRPHNTIPFSELIGEDKHYILFYDTSTKNVFECLALADSQTNFKIVSVPLLSELEPDGVNNYLNEWVF